MNRLRKLWLERDFRRGVRDLLDGKRFIGVRVGGATWRLESLPHPKGGVELRTLRMNQFVCALNRTHYIRATIV